MKNLSLLLFVILLQATSCKAPKESATNVKETETTITQVEGNLAEKLKYSGIDFYARGNEPFWGLDLDFQKQFVFYGLGLDSIVFPPVKPIKAQDANVMRFYALTNSGTVNIQISAQECVDNMSGEKFTFKTEIQIVDKKGEKLYTGCGNFIPDYRLHDIWALIEIKSPATQSMKKLSAPKTMMELHIDDQKIMGQLLCNSFTGNLWLQGNEIRFKNLAATEMACEEDVELTEMEITNYLSQVSRFELENGQLKLYSNQALLLVYKKID